MTGLDIEKDKIIEMACIITDSDLNVLAEVRLSSQAPTVVTSFCWCIFFYISVVPCIF